MQKSHKIQDFFKPQWVSKLTRATLFADFLAGITGVVMVLPQSIAFAMIAGMPPIYGLYSAMLVPVLAALFGSSRHMVSGPATAICIAIYASVIPFAKANTPEYIQLVLLLTFMVGLIQFLFGVLRLGKVVNFVSHSVVVGFTAGAAILIMNSQVKHFFGLTVEGNNFSGPWKALLSGEQFINWRIPLIAFFALGIAILFKKINKKLPYLLITIVLSTILSILLGGESAGISTVGKFTATFPPLSLPNFDWEVMKKLMPGAFAVAMLGLIEAIAIGKSIGLRSQQRIDTNKEFIGQGFANLVGSFFSSFVGSGSFSRSGVNYDSGAKTPISVVFTSILLILVLTLVSSWAAHLPIPAMGGVIFLVGLGLIDVEEIKKIYRCSRYETVVFLVTLLSTLLISLEYAILLGIITSLAFFLLEVGSPNIATMAPNLKNKGHLVDMLYQPEAKQCPQIKIIRIDGPIFYGSLDHIASSFDDLHESEASYCLVLAAGVNFIGMEGANWLTVEAKKWTNKGGGLYFANLKLIAQDTLIKGGFKEKIGEQHFFNSKSVAIDYLYNEIDDSICASCPERVFAECKKQ